MNKYQIVCFSPTGNTKYLANILKYKLNCEITEEGNCEHLIIMSSIHAFRVPKLLLKKIKEVKKISIIAVGCNNGFVNDNSFGFILKYAKKKGIEIGVCEVIAMPLTIVKKFNLQYGYEVIQGAIKKIDDIYVRIINNNNSIPMISFKAKIFSNIHHIENLFVKLFGLELKANNNCISCGLCERACPKKNIKVNEKPKFKLKCMLCMSCIYNCPKRAIHPRFSKFIEFRNGYNVQDYLKKMKNDDNLIN